MNDKQLMRIIWHCQKVAEDKIKLAAWSAAFVTRAEIRYQVVFPDIDVVQAFKMLDGRIVDSDPTVWRLEIGKTTATWKEVSKHTLCGVFSILGMPREIKVDLRRLPDFLALEHLADTSGILENDDGESKQERQ